MDKNFNQVLMKALPGIIVATIFPIVITVFSNQLFSQSHDPVYTMVGLVGFWIVALVLILLVKKYEKRALSSIGIFKTSFKTIAFGAILGILLSVTVPLCTLLINKILPAQTTTDVINNALQLSVPLLFFSIITAAITEELIFRGYLLTRLLDRGINKHICAFISIIPFSLIHLNNWSLNHIFGVVLPLGILLTYLYMWKRNLVFVMLVHFFIDVPLIIIALQQ